VLLLRIVEPEVGAILVDGVDVTTIGLHTLRRAIAVVPQDAFLFEGTIRRNLDPLNNHSLVDLTAALNYVGLHMDLDNNVGKGGGQLSSGQRQLIAMARATLSRARIVVMDEPTANCDCQTDAKLQELLSCSFTGRTVLCIAHRLNTIMGYDKILDMDKGTALEHGAPKDLLADPSTRFSQMAAGMQALGVDRGNAMNGTQQ
jgi:ABC-type multidrug transport system fused ATPase/permease subunit